MSHSITPTNTPFNLSPRAFLNQDLKAKNWKAMEEMMSSVPHLPNITNLTIDAQWQHLEASIAKLIAKCSRLERLSIDISRPVSPILTRICQTHCKNKFLFERVIVFAVRSVLESSLLLPPGRWLWWAGDLPGAPPRGEDHWAAALGWPSKPRATRDRELAGAWEDDGGIVHWHGARLQQHPLQQRAMGSLCWWTLIEKGL